MVLTTIGFLRRGDYFIFDGNKYKVGSLIKGTNGYIACTNMKTHRVKRFYIDTEVLSER